MFAWRSREIIVQYYDTFTWLDGYEFPSDSTSYAQVFVEALRPGTSLIFR